MRLLLGAFLIVWPVVLLVRIMGWKEFLLLLTYLAGAASVIVGLALLVGP